MSIQGNQIIGELVAQDYRTASVFKKYGIDFCCQGNKTIQDACDKKNIDINAVVTDLTSVNEANGNNNSTDYQSWPLDLMTDYIEKKHHRYVTDKTVEIMPYLEKIDRVHGDRHPELHEILEEFRVSTSLLAAHMKKEELILFPFIRKMVKTQQAGTQMEAAHFGNVENPINMMKHEHDIEGERFRKIATLSNNYTPPADACNTYRVTFALLKEFEDDLHLHIHLENNILFPKAILLEKQLSGQ